MPPEKSTCNFSCGLLVILRIVFKDNIFKNLADYCSHVDLLPLRIEVSP